MSNMQMLRFLYQEFELRQMFVFTGITSPYWISMMWDFSLYAMNIFYYHWLIKKLFQPISRAEYSQAGRDIERE